VEINSYDNIGRKRIDYWSEDNLSLSLFHYLPGKSGQTDEATRFILRFKECDSAILPVALMQVHSAVENHLERWKSEFGCRYIVPVPSHLAHEVSPSSKLMCRFIVQTLPWLTYPEELLFRTESVTPAHLAYPGQRPTSTEHFQSLGCDKVDLDGAGLILFDDIVTTGDTSQACRRRLQKDTRCGDVLRLFLGKTVT
jgi:hypothetical protein